MFHKKIIVYFVLSLSLLVSLFVYADVNMDSYAKAIELLNNQKFIEAEVEFKQQIKLNPDKRITKLYLGQCYLGQKNYKRARKYFKKLNPVFSRIKYPIGYLYVGYTYYAENKYRNAIYEFKKHQRHRKGLHKPKDEAKAYYFMAESYYKLNKYKSAEKNYKKSLKLMPNDFETNKSLGFLYFQTDIDKSINYLEKAYVVNQTDELNRALGEYYFFKSNHKKALKYFAKALEHNSKNKEIIQKIRRITVLIKETDKLNKIQNIQLQEKAPKILHNLISRKGRLKNKNCIYQLHEIMDLVWSEPEGKKILICILKNKIPIEIRSKVNASQSVTKVSTINFSVSNRYGRNLMPTSSSSFIDTDIKIIMKESQFDKFKNKNATFLENMLGIVTFVHELCHTIDVLEYGVLDNSKEEELLCSMIGMNIASKIVNKRLLNEKESLQYAKFFYKSILRAKEYESLAIHSGFSRRMEIYGLDLPHYELYSDFSKL